MKKFEELLKAGKYKSKKMVNGEWIYDYGNKKGKDKKEKNKIQLSFIHDKPTALTGKEIQVNTDKPDIIEQKIEYSSIDYSENLPIKISYKKQPQTWSYKKKGKGGLVETKDKDIVKEWKEEGKKVKKDDIEYIARIEYENPLSDGKYAWTDFKDGGLRLILEDKIKEQIKQKLKNLREKANNKGESNKEIDLSQPIQFPELKSKQILSQLETFKKLSFNYSNLNSNSDDKKKYFEAKKNLETTYKKAIKNNNLSDAIKTEVKQALEYMNNRHKQLKTSIEKRKKLDKMAKLAESVGKESSYILNRQKQ